MLSHRLDFAHFLVGPMRRVTALTSQIWPTRVDEAGVEHVSDTEDWVGCLAEFASGVTGVFESVKTATGYAGGATSRDFCEVNGSDGAVIYELSHPLRVLRAGKGGNYVEEAVPAEFRKIAGLAHGTAKPTRGRASGTTRTSSSSRPSTSSARASRRFSTACACRK